MLIFPLRLCDLGFLCFLYHQHIAVHTAFGNQLCSPNPSRLANAMDPRKCLLFWTFMPPHVEQDGAAGALKIEAFGAALYRDDLARMSKKQRLSTMLGSGIRLPLP